MNRRTPNDAVVRQDVVDRAIAFYTNQLGFRLEQKPAPHSRRARWGTRVARFSLRAGALAG
jgi:catechol 2,3-dioxygenase-like lactoylglutathione lyase family enzyme